jgi:hypothetical protein
VGKGKLRAVKGMRRVKPGSGKIRTNLYELVETVMDEAGPSDSELITRVVLRLLGNAKTLSSPTVHAGRWRALTSVSAIH